MPPLEVAFSGSGTFTIQQKLYLPSILHLTQTHDNSLTINALLSVRYYQRHLHASYTHPTHTTYCHAARAREGDITV